jgi:dihydrofolate reductase
VRKIIVNEFLSLDGVMEAPHLWHFPYISADMQEYNIAQIMEPEAFLLGRVTYQEFAPFWPSQTDDQSGIADKLNSAPKYVVSTTLDKADWNNTTLIKANVLEEIAKLKQQPGGNIGITGSATLVQSLLQAGLIDEYNLLVHLIVLGKGKRLFKEGLEKTGLKLAGTRTFNSGVVVLSYQPEGESK